MDACAAAAAVAAAAEGCLEADRWADMAIHVGEALGADTASFGLFGAGGESIALCCPRTDPEWHRRYDVDMHRLNYLWEMAARAPAGTVISDGTVGRERYLRSAIFNEFIRPQRMDPVLTISLSDPARPYDAILTLGRRAGAPSFDASDMADAGRLAVAISRTIAVTGVLRDRPGDPDREAPMMLVTPGGRVVARNATVERLLKAGDVVVRDGIVSVPALPGLHAAIAGAGRDPRAWPPPVALMLGPVSMTTGAVMLQVSPGGSSAPGATRLRFLIGSPDDPIAQLRRAYGLTERETEIALLISKGLGLPEASERLGIGLTTARTHLGRLFDKTGTRSQLALALLLVRRLSNPGERRED